MSGELLVPDYVELELPENKWERVLYINNVVEQLSTLSNDLLSYNETLKAELEGDESDKDYHVIPEFEKRKSTVVDEERLQQELPNVWRECLVIKPNEAAKIIGMDKLWTLCLKYGGEERTLGASHVTLEQMRKVMTEEEFKKYTTEIHKQKGLIVTHK